MYKYYIYYIHEYTHIYAAQYKDVFISKITPTYIFMYLKPRIHVRKCVIFV